MTYRAIDPEIRRTRVVALRARARDVEEAIRALRRALWRRRAGRLLPRRLEYVAMFMMLLALVAFVGTLIHSPQLEAEKRRNTAAVRSER